MSLLQQRYLWQNVIKQVKQYVRQCNICQQIKHSTIKKRVQTPLLIVHQPYKILYLDHCGLLQSDNRFNYILVAVDSCSRFL